MNTRFEFLDIDDAIEKLSKIKKENGHVTVCMIDFDNDKTDRKVVTYDEGCKIIRNGATIAYNHDSFISHLEVFSTKQKDIENILPIGVIHDILIGEMPNKNPNRNKQMFESNIDTNKYS